MSNTTTSPTKAALLAVARKRCPQCGQGAAFAKWGRLKPQCEVCGRVFQRLSGSTTGTMQVGGMVTVVFAILMWFAFYNLAGLSMDAALIAMLAASGVFGVWFFPYAKLLWEAVDYLIDSADEGNV
jgi:uncharacterized protein (DUF983 family)